MSGAVGIENLARSLHATAEGHVLVHTPATVTRPIGSVRTQAKEARGLGYLTRSGLDACASGSEDPPHVDRTRTMGRGSKADPLGCNLQAFFVEVRASMEMGDEDADRGAGHRTHDDVCREMLTRPDALVAENPVQTNSRQLAATVSARPP